MIPGNSQYSVVGQWIVFPWPWDTPKVLYATADGKYYCEMWVLMDGKYDMREVSEAEVALLVKTKPRP